MAYAVASAAIKDQLPTNRAFQSDCIQRRKFSAEDPYNLLAHTKTTAALKALTPLSDQRATTSDELCSAYESLERKQPYLVLMSHYE